MTVGNNETTPLLPDSPLDRSTKPSESRISETALAVNSLVSLIRFSLGFLVRREESMTVGTHSHHSVLSRRSREAPVVNQLHNRDAILTMFCLILLFTRTVVSI